MLRHLWGTVPVLTRNLTRMGITTSRFNQKLKAAAVTSYEVFISDLLRRQPELEQEPRSVFNNSFFEHQRLRAYRLACPAIASSPEATRLENEFLSEVAVDYLNANGASSVAELLDVGALTLDMWATVQQGEGAYHGDHVHEGVVASGVYYAATPEGCAPLVLRIPSDVRGVSTLGDLDEDSQFSVINDSYDIAFQPREGDVILFPSWLLHGVPPIAPGSSTAGCEGEARVSFAFNVSGYAKSDPWKVISMSATAS